MPLTRTLYELPFAGFFPEPGAFSCIVRFLSGRSNPPNSRRGSCSALRPSPDTWGLM